MDVSFHWEYHVMSRKIIVKGLFQVRFINLSEHFAAKNMTSFYGKIQLNNVDSLSEYFFALVCPRSPCIWIKADLRQIWAEQCFYLVEAGRLGGLKISSLLTPFLISHLGSLPHKGIPFWACFAAYQNQWSTRQQAVTEAQNCLQPALSLVRNIRDLMKKS